MQQNIYSRSATLGSVLFLFITMIFPNSATAGESAINCLAHNGKCTLPMGKETVTLEITPRPVTAMQDSTFTVTLTGNPPEQALYIDLGMPAMKMGPNRVQLKPGGNGDYVGKGVIVRCKSGRRTWFANVVVPGMGEAKFIFDVVY
ncbi:MAG: hypothetical protein QNI95_18940 [Desulfobacterales bacterium]|nr:hypothetical protein [Desulfobacterales bacterium]